MSPELFKIVFRGELIEGITREEAQANVKARFNYSDGAVARLFSSRSLILKGELEQATALKYQQALAKAGLVCEVLPMVAAAPSAPQTEPPDETAVAAPWSPEPAVEPEPVRTVTTKPIPEPVPEAPPEPVILAAEEPETPAAPPIAPAEEDQEDDPFRSFAADAAEVEPDGEADDPAPVLLTRTIIQSLKQTRPWVRFISILLFLGAVLGLFGSLAPLVAGVPGMPGGSTYMAVFACQALFSLVYLIPALYLFKYASSIGTLVSGGGVAELETALMYQKSFWKFSGVLALIGLIVGVLGVATAVVMPRLLG